MSFHLTLNVDIIILSQAQGISSTVWVTAYNYQNEIDEQSKLCNGKLNLRNSYLILYSYNYILGDLTNSFLECSNCQ
jgi:hypothetical protein